MQEFNLYKLRIKNNLTQKDISIILKTNQNTYSYWEKGSILIPLDKADELAMYYNVSLDYLLGLSSNYKYCKLKSIDYEILKKNLILLKAESRESYSTLASILKIDSASLYRYINGQTNFKVDVLIKLSGLFKISIDKLCGKL